MARRDSSSWSGSRVGRTTFERLDNSRRLRRRHQRGGDLGHSRVPDERLDLRDLVPTAAVTAVMRAVIGELMRTSSMT